MKINNSQFVTKTSINAQLNSPLVTRKMLVDEWQNAEIKRKTTELAGAFPYLFNITSYICENYPNLVKRETDNFYYQIGTEADPIPWKMFLNFGIGEYKDQKHQFLVELKRIVTENKPYFLPTDGKNMTLAQPFRIVLITSDMQKLDVLKMKNLKNEELVNYVFSGVIMECYKPLFAGHFNGYKDGFIKQPSAWYAKIKNDVTTSMIKNKAKFFDIIDSGDEIETESNMTALNVMKIWEYLAIHDNGQGKIKNVDVVDLLSHVAPSYLQKGEYLRNEYIGSLVNAFIALVKLTSDYRKKLDFEIVSIELDEFDRVYALNHGHCEGSPLFIVEAVKHRLKTHKNILTLQISREKERGYDKN
jgi:hypothetical protein